ncbi:MAG: DUF3592 domain-containing protein [Anaerolineales bacterium]
METNMILIPALFGLFCFIVPAILWGFFLLLSVLRSSRAVGKIIEYESGSSDGDVAAPIIEFQIPDGRKFTFKGMYSNESIFDIAYNIFLKYILKRDPSLVNVLYDPKDPQKARINSIGNIYFLPMVLFIVGLCIILSSIPMFRPLFDLFDRITKSL